MKRTFLFALLFAILSGCGESVSQKLPEIIKTKSGVEMILIPAGTFQMGSASGKEDERPVHAVTLDAFFMDRTEVTQQQYIALKYAAEGSHFKGADNPVEQIKWDQAVVFCNERSKAEGFTPCYNDEGVCNFNADGYRLPTEAEWEYACRAGTTTDYSTGNDARRLSDHAWYANNANKKTHPVSQKHANPWGLYDMHGNVAEWCNDVYDKDYYKKSPAANPRGPSDGSKYVLRGGSWDMSAQNLRSAARAGENPGVQDACFARDAIGFRCVRRVAAK